MNITCPGCGARYRIKPGGADKPAARVRCPKCAHVFAVSLSPSPPAAGKTGALSEKILLVDDARFFRELIADVLQPMQREVLLAEDGEKALALARRERPCLVILDLNLPQMNGYDLVRALREETALAGVKILAMSGVFRKDEDVAAVQRAGADDFTSKSFKPEDFLARVKSLLGE